MSNDIATLLPSQLGINQKSATASNAAGTEQSNQAKQNSNPQALAHGENVAISPKAKLMQDVTAQLKDMPEVNQQQVAELRQKIARGEYQINPESIAEKLVALDEQFAGKA